MTHRHQTACLGLALVFAAACAPALPTVDDSPEPPVTPIVAFPGTCLPARSMNFLIIRIDN